MQERQILAISLCSLAVVSGAFGLFVTGAFDGNIATTQMIPKLSQTSGMMVGHAIIEAHDSEGNLIAHRQTDNEVVNGGENCVLKMLFGAGGPAAAGSTVCASTTTSPWTVIAVGTNSSTAHDGNSGLKAEVTGDGLTRARAGTSSEVTWTNGTGATAAKIVLSKTFTATDTYTVTESGLFNSTTANGGSMLARQTFSGVALSSGDSITVTWTFTVGD